MVVKRPAPAAVHRRCRNIHLRRKPSRCVDARLPSLPTSETPLLARQLALDLRRPVPLQRDRFVTSSSNADAVHALDAFPDPIGGVLAIVGPQGVGKSHLLTAWAHEHDAVLMPGDRVRTVDLASLEGRLVAVDEAEAVEHETLFHLINLAQSPGGGLVIASRTRPAAWSTDIPDLASRLAAVRVATIAEPDDDLLRALLRSNFERRVIKPSDELIDWLLRRIERSATRAAEVAAALDEAASASNRPVSRVLAREVLGADPDETVD